MFKKTLLLIAILSIFISQVSIAKLCSVYQSCAEVISDHPDGIFGIRDRDKDGIPCENVCRSRKQVQELLNRESGMVVEPETTHKARP